MILISSCILNLLSKLILQQPEKATRILFGDSRTRMCEHSECVRKRSDIPHFATTFWAAAVCLVAYLRKFYFYSDLRQQLY